MADRSDVRCFEDVAGVVHLGFSADTLQACCGVEMTHAFAPVTVVVASGADVALTETLTTGEEKWRAGPATLLRRFDVFL